MVWRSRTGYKLRVLWGRRLGLRPLRLSATNWPWGLQLNSRDQSQTIIVDQNPNESTQCHLGPRHATSCNFVFLDATQWCVWKLGIYPLVNKQLDPEYHNFLMETSLPTPTTARVYVNLPEGNRNLWPMGKVWESIGFGMVWEFFFQHYLTSPGWFWPSPCFNSKRAA